MSGKKVFLLTMAKILTPIDLYEVFVTLQAVGLNVIVVGGQAVNLRL